MTTLTIEEIFSLLEQYNITHYIYSEEGKECGVELNTYTPSGVNEIIFVDFRNTKLIPTNPNDFVKQFSEYVESIDIDERIENNRQDPEYKKVFSLSNSVEDFTEWEKNLLGIVSQLKK